MGAGFWLLASGTSRTASVTPQRYLTITGLGENSSQSYSAYSSVLQVDLVLTAAQ